jgi:hypothetical protein
VTARLHQYTPLERRRTDISLSRQQMSFPLGRGAVVWFDEPAEVTLLIEDLTAAREAWEHHRQALAGHAGIAEYVASHLTPDAGHQLRSITVPADGA